MSGLCLLTDQLVKLLWLLIDPFVFLGRFSRILERLLNEMTFSLIYSAYATILYIWYSLTEKIFNRNNQMFKSQEEFMLDRFVQRMIGEEQVQKNSSNSFPKILLYFKHMGLPKAIIFYSVQIFSSSLKNYQRSSYLILLQTASIVELTIMILLIIEFLLMSRFLNTIMNQEQKKMNIIKNSISKNAESKGEVIALHEEGDMDE